MDTVNINGNEFVVIPVGRYKGCKKDQKEFMKWLNQQKKEQKASAK